jgi:acyl-CoA synthetase (AMP-forming)/AMP-acid ligase II
VVIRLGVEFNIGSLVLSVADLVPDRPAIIHGPHRTTFAELIDRATRLAGFLHERGIGCFAERKDLAGHESGQHLMAQFLHNGATYLEGMIGAYCARVAPFNVNYRYVAEELRYVLDDARPRVVLFHSALAPILAKALESDHQLVLLQLADESGQDLLPGALWYEDVLESAQPYIDPQMSPDDLYVLYTGGTTGMPKGVLWRQADIAVTALGLVDRRTGREWDSVEGFLANLRSAAARFMPCAPLMHGAAQWGALQTLAEGGCVVFPSDVHRFEPADVWDTVVRELVTAMSIVGDAFGRALAEELEHSPRHAPSLRFIISGGAALQPVYKQRLLSAVPGLKIIETIGSSETGIQGRSEISDAASVAPQRFQRGPGTALVSEDRTAFMAAGHPGIGWIASLGRVPLGYLGDREKTGQSFPVVKGTRVSLPGDRARLLPDDTVELLGRDSVTINSGGEKIFAEEVEAALKSHPDIADAVVCGRPSTKWGSEVVAIVTMRAGTIPDSVSLRQSCAQRIAPYKLPKEFIYTDHIQRSPAGKPDYRWAVEQVTRDSDLPVSGRGADDG